MDWQLIRSHVITLFMVGCCLQIIATSDCGPQRSEVPQNQCPGWDTDCDGISNAVELNSVNSYLHLDTARAYANPSIAHGTPSNGWIEKGINMVNSGTGYYHYLGTDDAETDDWAVLAMINIIEGAGRAWHDGNQSPPRIGIGDLSKGNASTEEFGGSFPPHTSHQNGLDVDIRYIRKDNKEDGLNLLDTLERRNYDTTATIALMNYLFSNGTAARIIVSQYCGISFKYVPATYDTTGAHDNHFHLRIVDPDGTGN